MSDSFINPIDINDFLVDKNDSSLFIKIEETKNSDLVKTEDAKLEVYETSYR